jgi:outer membrane protein assembly factor BamB
MKKAVLCVTTMILFTRLTFGTTPSEYDRYWPQWRGPRATGVAPWGNPPVHWDENTNIRWKIPIPGRGQSTPVVWGNQIFVTTAIETDISADDRTIKKADEAIPDWMRREGVRPPMKVHKFVILSIHRHDGRILWQRTLNQAQPHEATHKDGSWASGSPVTDGEHVFAYFGSFGLYCLDMQGNVIWGKNLGNMRTRNSFGEGNSPVLHGDKLIVNWDHEGDSFIVALNKKTGREIWKTDRDEITSWSTPIIAATGGKKQVIVNATRRIRGYDLDTGNLIWESEGMTSNVIPSPVHGNGMVYVMSGFRGSALQAIQLDKAQGDITGTDAVAWTLDKNTPYTPSPLLYDDYLYFFRINKEILSCYNALTGELYYGPERLEGVKGVYASPVGVDGRVYIVGRNGVACVIKHGPKFELLARNTLDDSFDASPVIVGDELYLRGRTHLYCIARD